MGWEQRGNNHYFYRKEWQDGRCVSTYFGTGTTAVLVGEYERLCRLEEDGRREQERRRRVELEVGNKAVASIGKHLRDLTYAVLCANGFHQHKGQWRKRMEHLLAYGELSPVPEIMQPSMVDPAKIQRGLEALDAGLKIEPQGTGRKGAVTSADKALAEMERRRIVCQVLNDYPCIWPSVRLMLTTGKHAMLEMAGYNQYSVPRMILERSIDCLRDQLGYVTSPVLEQMLIEHVVLAWLDLDIVQMKYAGSSSESQTLTSGAYWDRRFNSAQQRYLRAIETLARVRRLSRVTPLQVNIGGQQINVAGGGIV